MGLRKWEGRYYTWMVEFQKNCFVKGKKEQHMLGCKYFRVTFDNTLSPPRILDQFWTIARNLLVLMKYKQLGHDALKG